jgi:hypothetical protein
MRNNLKRLREVDSFTKASMETRITTWQSALQLNNWDIQIEWDSSLVDSEAEITYDHDYLLATLRVSKDWPLWTEEWADLTIVHELLHLFDRDRDLAAKSVEDLMNEQAFKMYENRYDHEKESSVDHLATIIVALAKDNMKDDRFS